MAAPAPPAFDPPPSYPPPSGGHVILPATATAASSATAMPGPSSAPPIAAARPCGPLAPGAPPMHVAILIPADALKQQEAWDGPRPGEPGGPAHQLAFTHHDREAPPVGDGPAAATALANAEAMVRAGFLRKVLGIVGLQLIATMAVACVMLFTESVRTYVHSHGVLLVLAMVVGFGTLLGLMCCQGLLHSYPTNLVLLAVFTLAQAFLVGTVTARYNTRAVVVALGITSVVVAVLFAFASQTSVDFTQARGVMLAALLGLILFGIVGAFFPSVGWIRTAYAAIGSVVFSVYLIIDLQTIMGGGRVQLSPDDYIMGAIMIYLDLINLFLMVLCLGRGARGLLPAGGALGRSRT